MFVDLCRQNRSVHSENPRGGVVTVELAIIAPIFLLLLAGVLEIGQAMFVKHSLSTAARCGARMAAISGSTEAAVAQKVKDVCSRAIKSKATAVTVEVTVNGKPGAQLPNAVAGDEICVSVGVPFSSVCVGFFSQLFKTQTLRTSCIYPHE